MRSGAVGKIQMLTGILSRPYCALVNTLMQDLTGPGYQTSE